MICDICFILTKNFLDLINRKGKFLLRMKIYLRLSCVINGFLCCLLIRIWFQFSSRQAIMIHRISMENLRMNLFNWRCAINNCWWISIRMNSNHFHIQIRHSLQHHHLWQQPSKFLFILLDWKRQIYLYIVRFAVCRVFRHCVWFYYSVNLFFFFVINHLLLSFQL